MIIGLDILIGYSGILLKATLYALIISVSSFILGFVIGLSLSTLRVFSGNALLKSLIRGYVELIRGTPMLVQLFFIYYALPQFGPTFDPVVSSIIAFSLNSAAYQEEYLRAGILSVPNSQYESALSMGLKKWEAVREVVIPLAFRASLPSLNNEFVALFKYSSIASFVTVPELFYTARTIASSSFMYIQVYIALAIIYVITGIALSRIFKIFEKMFYIPGFL